jgi:pimeloyl-ACP methyl ester carboxylesterase
VARFIDARRYGSVDVLGHSMGGWTAQAGAPAPRQGRPAGPHRHITRSRSAGRAAHGRPDRGQARGGYSDAFSVQDALYLWAGLSERSRQTELDVLRRIQAQPDRGPVVSPEAWLAQAVAGQRFVGTGEDSNFADLGRIDAPTLVVGGEFDWLTGLRLPTPRGQHPGAQLYVDREAGHAPHNTARARRAILAFLH